MASPRSFHILMLAMAVAAGAVAIWLGGRDDTGAAGGRQGMIGSAGRGDGHGSGGAGAEATSGRSQGKKTELHPARENELVLRFRDDAAYRAFLAEAGRHGVAVLGQMDALRMARIGLLDRAAWDAWDGDKGESAPNFLVAIPELPEGGVQDGAVGFGKGLLDWLGVTGDNAGWGKGVTVAVLDTGVAAHPGLPGDIRSFSLLEKALEPSFNGHGTAVASLIAGADARAPGVAPGVDLLSIQVIGADGMSDTFTLAQGIVMAADKGAKVINVSLGSAADSRVMRDAVAYAMAKGAVVVASAGNNGVDGLYYPAANEGVVSVGAVDARGEHLDFSNRSWNLDATAPGYELNVAWPGERTAGFTGTSASAPVVAGAIAAVMSEFDLPAAKAADAVLNHMNENGAPGYDPEYGRGTLDVGRVMQMRVPGVNDAAVASQSLRFSGAYGLIEVVVQNRGTTVIDDATIRVGAADQSGEARTGRLAPGEHVVRRVRVEATPALRQAGATVRSSVTLGAGILDAKPSNDTRSATVVE